MSDTRRAPEASSADAGPVGSVSRPSFKRTLTFFGFFAITASMVMTVYEYPSFASSGFQLVFFLIIGGILWFLPVALCAAEMATVKGWESGGIFAWVGNTLGRRWGFAALFFQWFQITVGFVTMAFFILAALTHRYPFGGRLSPSASPGSNSLGTYSVQESFTRSWQGQRPPMEYQSHWASGLL